MNAWCDIFLLHISRSFRQTDSSGAQWCVCVCVSTPVPKGSLPTSTFFTAGGHPPPQWRMANEEATGGGCKRTCRTVVQAVTPLFLCLFPWWFMLLPLNPFPSVSAAVRRSSAAVASLQMRTNYLLKHLQLIGLLTLPLSHSFPRGIELTEYKCRSVFRSAVPLGC